MKTAQSSFTQCVQRLSATWRTAPLLHALLVCGLLLHVRQYWFNRSLWVDEAALALNILDKSYSQLLQPLDLNQVAPIGFLLVTKLLTQLLGSSEYVLRLIPVFSGIAALWLFRQVASRFLEGVALALALTLFATSGVLLYYSSALKQYSSDVCLGLALFLILYESHSTKLTWRRSMLIGAAGALALWFSHPAVFMLAGLGTWQSVLLVRERHWQQLRHWIPAVLMWSGSFALLYVISFRHAAENAYLQHFWREGFMPFPPTSLADVSWFGTTFVKTIGYFIGIPLLRTPAHLWEVLQTVVGSVTGLSPSANIPIGQMLSLLWSSVAWLSLYLLASLLALIGGITLCLTRPKRGISLIAPALAVLAASGLQVYPFADRVILFLLPFGLIILARGIALLWEHLRPKAPLVGVLLIGALCVYPVWKAGYHVVAPRKHEEARPVLRYLEAHNEEQDVLYVYYASQGVFEYYSRRLELPDKVVHGVMARDDWNGYLQDIDQLRGHDRVWLFFSHAYSEEDVFLWYLDRIGTRLDEYKDIRASVYLYDLNKPQ